MQKIVQAAAEALADALESARQWVAPDEGPEPFQVPEVPSPDFAGIDIVGIDFSTSIQQISVHMIDGWDRYCRQLEAIRPDHGVWAFGVNALPFPLTSRPVLPCELPSFHSGHFQSRRYHGGLIEYGSTFYDYFHVAIGHAADFGGCGRAGRLKPISISLLCDGFPNGGSYRADDIRPLVMESRNRGVRFKLVAFASVEHRWAMNQFRESLGLHADEFELGYYRDGVLEPQTIADGFASLSCWECQS